MNLNELINLVVLHIVNGSKTTWTTEFWIYHFFSNEACFGLNGYIDSQNYSVWSAENPFIFEKRPLHFHKVSIWLAVSHRRVIGPIFVHNTINFARYREQILEVFLNPLDDEELQFGSSK
mgnify:CR=1 FL=1